jgi:very-short-patch-repair endonuclease
MEPTEILRAAGGVAPTGLLVAHGIGDAVIRSAIRNQRILRLERGLLAVHGADPEYVAARRSRALLTCISACKRYGLWMLHEPAKPHYWFANGRRTGNFVSHRAPLVQRPLEEPVAALPDVLLHSLLCRPALESLVMVECAVNRGDVDVSWLMRRLPGRRCGKAREVLAKVERGADSLLETLARVLFRDAGIRVETQVWIDGIGRVDFLLEGFLIVELDGLAFHLDRRQFKKDRRRDNAAVLRGLLVLRYFYDDVVHAPEALLEEVQKVLRTGSLRHG